MIRGRRPSKGKRPDRVNVGVTIDSAVWDQFRELCGDHGLLLGEVLDMVLDKFTNGYRNFLASGGK